MRTVGDAFNYQIEVIDECQCEAATVRSWWQRKTADDPAVQCKKLAHVKIAGLALCTVHAGQFVTWGSIPAVTGGVWQDLRRE